MPRRARLCLPNVPMHVIQRGNNRQPCFFEDDDHEFYLVCLKEYARATGCQLHAFVLMTNHVHLLVSSETTDGVGALMKAVGQRYVPYINRTYGRTGSLWEGRFRSALTEDETYLLTCQRYIELNPVRASMVAHPADYRWSSYRTNALGEPNDILTPHRLYASLGGDPAARQAAYRDLFRDELDPDLTDTIRNATNGNFVLGSARFADEIAQALGRRTTPGKAGRPHKSHNGASPESNKT